MAADPAQRANNLFLYRCMRSSSGIIVRTPGDCPVGTSEEVSVAWLSYAKVKKQVSRALKLVHETDIQKKELGLDNGPLSPDEEKRKIMLLADKRLEVPSVTPADEKEMVLWHEAQVLKLEKEVINKETLQLYEAYKQIWPLEHEKRYKEEWEMVEDVISDLYDSIIEHVRADNERGTAFRKQLDDWRRADKVIGELWTEFLGIFHAATPMECFDVASAERFFEYEVRKPGYSRRSLKAMAARILKGFDLQVRPGLRSTKTILRR
jgi:hypothetical protein